MQEASYRAIKNISILKHNSENTQNASFARQGKAPENVSSLSQLSVILAAAPPSTSCPSWI